MWSFGNNAKDFAFSKKIEPYKRSLHNAVVFNEFDELAAKTLGIDSFDDDQSIKQRRLFLRRKITGYLKTSAPDFLHKFLSLQQLERLERLQQLQQLERLQQLQFYNTSYDQILIKENAVIYCDPPYRHFLDGYSDTDFKHDDFLNWAADQKCPVFISDYSIPDARFYEVFSVKNIALLNSATSKKVTEKVYVNQAGYAAMVGNAVQQAG